jgi:hypothetical protein
MEVILVDKKKKPIKFLTASFNFEIDEYLRERFGLNDGEIVISLVDAELDFGRLLVDKNGKGFSQQIHGIDLKKQDYDLILSVYAFFLKFKKNAYLRQLQFNNETLAFEIEQAKKVITLMPEIILAIQKKGNIKGL